MEEKTELQQLKEQLREIKIKIAEIEMSSKLIDTTCYKSVNEAIEDLAIIEKCDLVSGETSMEEAINFCAKVCKVLLKSRNLRFNESEKINFSKALKGIGCVSYSDSHKIYQKEVSISESLASHDIAAPLVFFNQLIDSSENAFEVGLGGMNEGGFKDSWIGEWLKTQGYEEIKEDPQK